jgi:hypothetical protein
MKIEGDHWQCTVGKSRYEWLLESSYLQGRKTGFMKRSNQNLVKDRRAEPLISWEVKGCKCVGGNDRCGQARAENMVRYLDSMDP